MPIFLTAGNLVVDIVAFLPYILPEGSLADDKLSSVSGQLTCLPRWVFLGAIGNCCPDVKWISCRADISYRIPERIGESYL